MAPSKKNNIEESEGSMAYCIVTSDIYGRYLAAARDIKPGEIILKEFPLVVGPQMDSSLICFGCYRLLGPKPVPCSKCQAVYLCSKSCETNGDHVKFECKYLKSANVTDIFKENQIILPFRCILLRRSQNESSKWDALMDLQSHDDSRHNSAIWRSHQKHVIQVMKDKGILLPQDTEEILQKVCGVLDVNSFEVRRPYGSERLRALYHCSSFMAHDCVGNTHIAVDENFCITVRASVSIMKGQPVLFNYTSALQGTEERQEHLKEGKYFECRCRRCLDPTELGSHMSSIFCPRCRDGLVCPTELPLIMSGHWACRQCGHKYTKHLVQSATGAARFAIEQVDRESIYQMEKLLSELEHSFPPHNTVVLELKQMLIAMYRDSIQTEENPCRKVLVRKIDLCKDLLPVLRTLEPGISRLAGIALYELHIPTVMLANHDYHSGAIQTTELLEQLSEAENYLKEAVQYLLYEPPHTPEGQLARIAMQDLKALRVNIGHIHQVHKSQVQDKNEHNSITNMKTEFERNSNTADEIEQIKNNNLQKNEAKQIDKAEQTTAKNQQVNKTQGQEKENINSQTKNDKEDQNKTDESQNANKIQSQTKTKLNKNTQQETQRKVKVQQIFPDDHKKSKIQSHKEIEQSAAEIQQKENIQKEGKKKQNSNSVQQMGKSEKEIHKQNKNSNEIKRSQKKKKRIEEFNNTQLTTQTLQNNMKEKICAQKINELQKDDKPKEKSKDIILDNQLQEQEEKTTDTNSMQEISNLKKENALSVLEKNVVNVHSESQEQTKVTQSNVTIRKKKENSEKDKIDRIRNTMEVNKSQDKNLEQNMHFKLEDKSKMSVKNEQNNDQFKQVSEKRKEDVHVNKKQQTMPQKRTKGEKNCNNEKNNNTKKKNKDQTVTNSTQHNSKSQTETTDKNNTNSTLEKQGTLEESKTIQSENDLSKELKGDRSIKIQLTPEKEKTEEILETHVKKNKLKNKLTEQNEKECTSNKEKTDKLQRDNEIKQKDKNDSKLLDEIIIQSINENKLSNKSQDEMQDNTSKETDKFQTQVEKDITENSIQQKQTSEIQHNIEQSTNNNRKRRNRKKKLNNS